VTRSRGVAGRLDLAVSVVAALAVLGLLYRWLLARALLASGVVEMRHWLGRARPPWRFALEASSDWPLLLGCAVLVALLPAGSRSALWRRGARLTASLLVLAAGAAAAVHVRLLVETQSPIDLELLREAIASAPVDSLDFVSARELSLLLVPPALVLLLATLPGRGGRLIRFGLALVLLVGPLAAYGWLGTPVPRARRELRLHPARQLAEEIFAAPDLGLEALPSLGSDQARTIALVDPIFGDPSVAPDPARSTSTPVAGRAPDLIVVVLESTAFEESLGGEGEEGGAMPFLAHLAREGWSLADHHSTANSTPRALFSILTGLYPPPDASMFVTGRKLTLPALPGLLPGYGSVLVSTIDTAGLFPRGLLLNNGLALDLDHDSITPQAAYPEPRAGRSERLTFRLLRERLRAPHDVPLFALYMSFAPHQPYFDQDAAHEGAIPSSDEHTRYLACLRLLDDELRGLVEEIESSGRAADTVLLVVADHGEAFQQHGLKGHIRSTHEEILHVPAVLWAPGRLGAETLSVPTSHVDLVPTLLDLVGVPFEPHAFQGVSLLRRPLPRRLLFAVGAEQKLNAISSDGFKISWSFRDGRCRGFDLSRDRAERHPLPCARRQRQFDATRLFWRFQNRQLRRYESLLRHRRTEAPPQPLNRLDFD